MSRPPVTCLIQVHNEAARIRPALTHALRWADEVVVVDKSSSDDTPRIAAAMGARVVNVPWTPQGHECLRTLVSHATHDWVWLFTAGEVPTRACITAGLALVSDAVDAIAVPMFYYSFGVHSDRSPWAGGYQIRLLHRGRVTFTGFCHDPYRADRIARIAAAPGCHVLHQTHATAADFMRSHADYMVQEAARGDPHGIMRTASAAITQWEAALASDPALLGQALGWRLYWLGVALHAWERTQPSIPAAYAARTRAALAEWTEPPSP